ncbi:hypothetical protein BCR37DRAFT_162131 [Protomyces lactucae-debilis]|uniref:Uncharacterized protein n=1 Tax=Protomyces lactucae-debilis TaxID=2754530 RepID=A0A1Y2EYF0_PROLT|nr:uncharacterized protein BCR37DRAFT_162131 [Protomyces lactucae-debilis]ORY76623.1 hypothetical protein BCR37DRAFT_162131 [Protomyces lactucae-debilis]
MYRTQAFYRFCAQARSAHSYTRINTAASPRFVPRATSALGPCIIQSQPAHQLARRCLFTSSVWVTLLNTSHQRAAQHAAQVGVRARAAFTSIQARLTHLVHSQNSSTLLRSRMPARASHRIMWMRQVGYGSRVASASYVEHSPRPSLRLQKSSFLVNDFDSRATLLKWRIRTMIADESTWRPDRLTISISSRTERITQRSWLNVPVDVAVLLDRFDGWLLQQFAQWILRLFGWQMTLLERVQHLLARPAVSLVAVHDTDMDIARAAAMARLVACARPVQ